MPRHLPETEDHAALEAEAERAAENIAAAYERAGSRIEESLARAARQGEVSFSRMVDAMVADMARIAADRLIEAPLQRAFDRLGDRLRDRLGGQ